MARPSNSDERRAQIVHGLRRVMAQRGYDGASMGEIAKEAGLTTGLLHYHFEDKLEILEALALSVANETLGALAGRLEQLRPKPSSLAVLETVVDFYLGLGAHADAELLACWISLSAEALRHPKVQAAFATALNGIARVLEGEISRGVREKTFGKRVDAAACAAALVATIEGYYVLAGSAPALIPRGSAAKSVKLMMRGLLGVTP